MQLAVQYFDRESNTMRLIMLPEGADCVTVQIPEQPWYAPMAGISLPQLAVSVNADAVQIHVGGRRLAMWEYSDVIAEVAAENRPTDLS